jgi:hypothetical protein
MISAAKRLEFVSDRMSYVILRGHWCDTSVSHAPNEDKIDNTKVSFHEYFIQQFPKNHMKILLGNFNAKIGTEDIC